MELTHIYQKLHEIREQKIMLDFDLAILYEVENRALKQAVKRNIDRFPEDFMFQLTKSEWKELITNCDKLPDGIKFSPITPLAFTEQGVAMLSSVLKSKKALHVNVSIIRAFVYTRKYALSNKDLSIKLIEIETQFNKQFDDVFEAINYLLKKDKLEKNTNERKQVGYKNP
jgi:hypothetical protein